jgi:aryl-alcohol dehydrogenase-like predicted oxidoreductase
VPFSPLAGGLLTDRYLDPEASGPGDRLYDEGRIGEDATEDNLAAVRRVAALAADWGVEVSQLVLAYLLTVPTIGPLIPSSSTVEQLESNAAAASIALSQEQIQRVRDAVGKRTTM